MRKVRLFLSVITVGAFVLVTSCSKEETPEPVEITDEETNNNNNSGGGNTFDINEVDEFDIDEINLVSFDFNATNETDQEFYIEVWQSGNLNYQGNLGCVTQNTEAGDLPEELLCVNYLTYQNATFNNTIEIELWDEDQNSNDDDYGSVSFTPSDYIDAESGSKTITLTDGGNVGYTVEILISW
ncbi:MAG: hypothetical protein ACPGUU_06155 [Flavobacteriaceae bacterium]